MIIKKILFIVFFILISAAHSVENKILIKIDNDIITSIDILNEVNYLIAINKDIKKLEKNRIYEIAKNTVIRDKIKKNQILKVIKKIDLDKKYIAKIIDSTALKLGHETKKDFEMQTVHLWTAKNGMLTSYKHYCDTAILSNAMNHEIPQ